MTGRESWMNPERSNLRRTIVASVMAVGAAVPLFGVITFYAVKWALDVEVIAIARILREICN